ncbi:MAG: hypothetical protein R2822_17885 [Spirosomataceae bacterium]
MEFQNYETTAVKNGEQVMQIIDKEDFDIVLLTSICLSWMVWSA